MNALAAAARYALTMHDRLRETSDREPACDDDGMPLDPSAWLAWRTEESAPAYQDWRNAMDALEAMLGEPISRHPFNFRPLCERLIAS